MAGVPFKKNTAVDIYVAVVSVADTTIMQANPTIAAGDFKVSIDGGALANPATLPVVTPAASKQIKVALSAAEMNGDVITIIGSDAAGAEWCDVFVQLFTDTAQMGELDDDAITAAKIGADAIGASELAADAVAEIADKVWDEVLGEHVTAATTGAALTAILGAAPAGGVLGGGTVTLGDLVKEVALRLGSYRRLTATSGGLSSVFDTVGLIEPDDAFINLYAYVLEDAGGGGAAPEGEERLITAYTRSNAMLTVAPAFSSEVAVDDIVEILPERRDRIITAINAGIGAAGERWAVITRDTSTLTVVASTYEYDLATSFSLLSRLLSVWTRDEATEAWREIPSSNYHLTGTPGGEVLLFDTLEGLDAGDVLMLQYRQLPAKLTADTDTLGVGAVAERELVRFVVEYALGWLHQAAAATTPQDFREHWSLSKRHYDEAEKVRTGGGGRRRGGRVRYTRGSKARG